PTNCLSPVHRPFTIARCPVGLLLQPSGRGFERSTFDLVASTHKGGSEAMHDPQQHKHGPGLSRRQFLKGTGVSAAATALATTALPEPAEAAQAQQPAVPALGPAALKVTLNVNGKQMTANLEPRVTLLDALRNYLDVTGCKRVCDRGTCGACTVLLDGKVVYSCSMLAVEPQGRPRGRRTARGRPPAPGPEPGGGPAPPPPPRRPAVGLLHAGFRRRHAGRPGRHPPGHARRGRGRPVGEHLPLRHLRADAPRHR